MLMRTKGDAATRLTREWPMREKLLIVITCFIGFAGLSLGTPAHAQSVPQSIPVHVIPHVISIPSYLMMARKTIPTPVPQEVTIPLIPVRVNSIPVDRVVVVPQNAPPPVPQEVPIPTNPVHVISIHGAPQSVPILGSAWDAPISAPDAPRGCREHGPRGCRENGPR